MPNTKRFMGKPGFRWVNCDEVYTWCSVLSTKEEHAHVYEDGKTLMETFKDQYKLVPQELAFRLEAAWDVVNNVCADIDEYGGVL